MTDLSHRGRIPVDTIRPSATLLKKIGGRGTVERIVDGLYDAIEADPSIRPMFVRNLEGERAKQYDFWEEWLGGEPKYTQAHAYSGLQSRHSHLHITRAAADAWLSHLTDSLKSSVDDPAFRDEILQVVRPIALSFVNETKPAARDVDMRCRRIRPFRTFATLAAKDDDPGIVSLLDEAPYLLDDSIEMAEVMLAAALKGKSKALAALIEAGADPNHAAHYKEGCIFQSLMLTPLCGALLKDRSAAAQLLRDAGAVYDIFSAAYLGDLSSVTREIDRDGSLVSASDPASDVLEMTPLHHAVYGGHLDVVSWLFENGATVGVNDSPMVRHAANNAHLEIVRMLLDHGSDATRVGPGTWVLDDDMADLLVEAGADVNWPAGEWIWRSCTGNNSQRDRPDLVQALIDRGANLATRLRGATALHYTAKAGFLETTEVLIENGANPNLLTDDGESPLFYAFKAGKRSDVAAMCRLLVTAGSDVKLKNGKGLSVVETAERMRREGKKEILHALS